MLNLTDFNHGFETHHFTPHSLLRSTKDVIAVDIGGTIEDTWALKCNWFKRFGIDLGTFPISRLEIIGLLRGRATLYDEMVEEIYSPSSIINHDVIVGVKEAFQTLSKTYSIVLVSTRPYENLAVTKEWIIKHSLNSYISGISLVNTSCEPRSFPSKLEFCQHFDAVALIDDDIRHLIGDSQFNSSLKRILVAKKTNNLDLKQQGIIHASNWKEVMSILI